MREPQNVLWKPSSVRYTGKIKEGWAHPSERTKRVQITEKLLKPLPEVQYLNTENTDRYRCIMRIFYENTEKLHNWMYQEEVYDALRVFPEFRDYRLEQCQQDLTSLVNWHNLETLQDTRHVSSLEEFQSRRYRYQMSPYSVEIERLVLRLEHLEIEGGSLEPTLLERIRRAIERFPDMVDAEPAEAYDFWDDLERNFTRLNQNYHDYIRDLSSVRAEEMMHTQEFLLFKDKLVEYLRNFVTSLQRNVGVIEELLQALSPSLCEAVLEKVNAYEAAIPRMEQVAPETIAENNRGKLESIRRWFQTSEGEDNEAGKLFDATNDIIRRITRFAMEMSEKSAMGSNRREEYRKVAELFLACEDLSEAHQLSACIFGVETPRHLRSEVEANSQSMNMSALFAGYRADLFPGTKGVTQFPGAHTPAATLYNGSSKLLERPIYNITAQPDGSITFSYLDASITGIGQTATVVRQPAKAIYDMSGRRIASWETAAPGLYIVNGAKVAKR